MTTEEHCLSPVITEAVPPVPRQIATLRVSGPHTRLVILEIKIVPSENKSLIFTFLSQFGLGRGSSGNTLFLSTKYHGALTIKIF